METSHIPAIAKELSLKPGQVEATARLLEEGGTVPFIARYRKEATGSLDEVVVAAVRDRLEQLAELDKRRKAIIASLEERDLLTPDLARDLDQAQDMARLEDIYLPHRPKRKTRASIAREKGLERLATDLLKQRNHDPQDLARHYVDKEKGVNDIREALAGARDIIAEKAAETPRAREALRKLFVRRATVRSSLVKGKEDEGEAYRDWFDWEEPLRAIPGHRVLAMFRGEREKVLGLSIQPPEEEGRELLRKLFLRGKGKDSKEVGAALDDGYKRLLAPSLENEARAELKKRADQEAIAVFASNLRELLLAAPLGPKRILALDPGFRTGAKTVVLSAQGGLVEHTTIYPTGSDRQREEAAKTLRKLCEKHAVEAVAVGNGTAGRETERFVRGLGLQAMTIMVNEAGASVYSASETARKEFPDLDLTVRGAVSIGRRLMDPLAELVKIDPKSIGVGQYQHDVDQAALKRGLDDVVEACVNNVGVDLNTASPELLTYVAGLGPVLAANIVAQREEQGPFASRQDLLKVKRLGPKAFEQAAGFLRVKGDNPLDASAVHPERYALVKRMAQDAGLDLAGLLGDTTARERIDLEAYVSDDVGLPTLNDIMAELAKPGRDPRAEFTAFAFDENVSEIDDLRPGMRLPGIVTNVTKFGAFVDVGVHRDGLVHISQLADRYVADPARVVAVGQQVTVTVTEVDLKRGRIGLSMRGQSDGNARERRPESPRLEPGVEEDRRNKWDKRDKRNRRGRG